MILLVLYEVFKVHPRYQHCVRREKGSDPEQSRSRVGSFLPAWASLTRSRKPRFRDSRDALSAVPLIGLEWTFPSVPRFKISFQKHSSLPYGLEWTRTTDLTLIRRAL